MYNYNHVDVVTIIFVTT